MNTEQLERLYQDVEQGKVSFLTLDDEFKWSGCTMCGLCCFDIDILLNPYDILRLRRHLGVTTTDLIQKGLVQIFPGGSSGLPLAMIGFQKLDEETSACPFLAPVVDAHKLRELMKGKDQPSPEDLQAARIPNRLACGIHPARPTVCRSSPLGRMTVRPMEGEKDLRMFYQPPTGFCPGAQGEGRVKVSQWIEDNGVEPYWNASEEFHRLCVTMVEKGLMLKEEGNRTVAILWNLAAGFLYDFDSFETVAREFPQNRTREDGEEDLRLLSKLFQMVDALAASVAQVKENGERKAR